MFKGIVVADKFLLFHDDRCLVVQSSQDYGSLERMMKPLSATPTHTFREKLDATHLSSFQTSHHCVHARHHLQMQLADIAVKQLFKGFGRSSNFKAFSSDGSFSWMLEHS